VYIVDTAAIRLDSSNIKECLLYDFLVNTGERWDIQLTDGHIVCRYGGNISLTSKVDSIEAPAGVFRNCYNFTRVKLCRATVLTNDWFASGIGRVAYEEYSDRTGVDWFYLTYTNTITKVNDDQLLHISNYKLLQNYPNPFNPTTLISYFLPKVSYVTLKVYDIIGREVATLVDGRQSAGYHNITFNARDLPSGVYLYRIQADKFMETKKLLLLR
jgi:hypothetical protein